MIKTVFRQVIWPLVFMCIFVWTLYYLGYHTARENFVQFITLYLLAFLAFYVLWLNWQQFKFWQFLLLAIFIRLIWLDASPELSNDFYRFIWDGELLAKGINPYAHLPKSLISSPEFYSDQYMRILYHGMGDLSQDHYSCYPVLNQLLFYIPVEFTNGIQLNGERIAMTVMVFKLIIILADIGAIYFARKIALHLGVDPHKVWLYALNPFIILEYSFNLHFEGVMIFFLLAGLYFLMKKNWLVAAILFGCAIHIKLIPIMLIPFVFKKLKWKESIGFVAMTAFTVFAIGGLMLNTAFLDNMMQSINEYFIRFQFNSSFYNLIAYSGWIDHPERYRVGGQVLSLIATISILILAAFRAFYKDLDMIKGMLFAFVIYYTFATTVHPWYIGLILVLSIFTKYKFGVVWSLVVMLSYSAYAHPSGYQQVPSMIITEYVLVFGVLIYEIIRYWRKEAVGIQLKAFFQS